MSKAREVFSIFEKNGIKALDLVRERSFTPNTRKILRTWGVNEASELIGRSRQVLLDAEKANKISPAKTIKKTANNLNKLKAILPQIFPKDQPKAIPGFSIN